MKKAGFFLPFASIALIALLSCQQAAKYSEEFIEVYDIASANKDAAKGTLQFMESFVKDNQGRDIAHGVYEIDTTIKAIEYFIYEEGSDSPKGSEYKDAADQMLSYYKFHYNDKGLKSRSIAFDGQSDEILRIENYIYDEDDNMKEKWIKTATDSIVRKMIFEYDEYGNELKLSVLNGVDSLLLVEEFEIIERTTDGRWTARYGYRNNIAKTFRKRYWKETSFTK